MKKKYMIVAIVISLVALLVIAFVYQFRLPKDRCTNKDREMNNCVPAGRCGPTPSIDAVTDCDVKNYDKKFNTEI